VLGFLLVPPAKAHRVFIEALGQGRPQGLPYSEGKTSAFAPNTELLVLNGEQLSEQEMVGDLLTVVHSARLNGLRITARKLTETLAEDVAQ
jgi:predicted site-specific integrase-resolvase